MLELEQKPTVKRKISQNGVSQQKKKLKLKNSYYFRHFNKVRCFRRCRQKYYMAKSIPYQYFYMRASTK